MTDAKVDIPGGSASLTEAALERYALELQRYLARRVRHAQDAPDLVQEIFARFLRKKERPEAVRNPFAYLLGIARNVLCESLGEEQHNPVVYNSELAEVVAEAVPEESSLPMADRLGEQRDIVDALSTLPESHLLAIMLVDGQGMSYAEAAEASGYTPATIATYVMHARAALRKRLPDYWGGGLR